MLLRTCNQQTLSCFRSNPGFVGEAPKRIGAPVTRRQMEQLLFTPEEVAHVLHISRRKVYILLRTGEIDSVRIGKCRRITRMALENFIERLTSQAGV